MHGAVLEFERAQFEQVVTEAQSSNDAMQIRQTVALILVEHFRACAAHSIGSHLALSTASEPGLSSLPHLMDQPPKPWLASHPKTIVGLTAISSGLLLYLNEKVGPIADITK